VPEEDKSAASEADLRFDIVAENSRAAQIVELEERNSRAARIVDLEEQNSTAETAVDFEVG